MKPIIGIITRLVLSDEKNKMYGAYEDMIKAISKNGGIPIGIFPNNTNVISLCNGIIFQGGDYYTEYEKKYLKYTYDNDIPTLGICLGMQHMAMLFDAKEYNINNHKEKNKKYVHKIIIDKNSKLYSIIKKEEILVNSRHTSAIKDTKLYISGTSEDGIIESIEDNSKKFFIGLQWHPESMINYCDISNTIFKKFIDICKN